jgi:glycine dehydrogenase subunit 2
MHSQEKVIFEYSTAGRGASDQWPADPGEAALADLPPALRRAAAPKLPEVSELEVVRHFTRLSQLNFSIDTHFYPLGSCTMKYNPKACNQYAMLPQFLARHPLAPAAGGQGFLVAKSGTCAPWPISSSRKRGLASFWRNRLATHYV